MWRAPPRVPTIAGMITLRAVAALLVLGTAASAEPAPDLAERLFALARPALDGERAHELVAEMEPMWRWPGNTGYDAAIDLVVRELHVAGYVPEAEADAEDRLTYRIETHPMSVPAWDPIDASLAIAGDADPLLRFETNRNMIAIHSSPTPPEGVEAPLVRATLDRRGRLVLPEGVDGVEDRVVLADANVYRLFRAAVMEGGAAGVLAYDVPSYNRPRTNRDAVPFGTIPVPQRPAWALLLSTNARDALHARLDELPAGETLDVRVTIDTRSFPSVERAVVAEVRGAAHPEDRMVLSAHVQEPGANDNASGVACQLEIARVLALLLQRGDADPACTVTMLFGNEIVETARFTRDPRAGRIRYGLSLDMVGQDTARTGGTFLIEKLPDPSAVWTRGEDRHTEWGGRRMTLDEMFPHHLNDVLVRLSQMQAEHAGWTVATNPFEGGSDHVPFLRAGVPAVLFWHFTDIYYHTDRDRIDMVSAATLGNVGELTLAAVLLLTHPDAESAALWAMETVETAALARLRVEAALGSDAIRAGADRGQQIQIVEAWRDWQLGAIASTRDIAPAGASPRAEQRREVAGATIERRASELIATLREP